MSYKVRIASVIAFVVLATASYVGKFRIVPGGYLPIYLILGLSASMYMVVGTKVSVWLKLFLLLSFFVLPYSQYPRFSSTCYIGLVSISYWYYFLTTFNKKEMDKLLKFVTVLIIIQGLWVLCEYIPVGQYLKKSNDYVGTIGYVNLTCLTLGATMPLVYRYNKKWLPVILIALIISRSFVGVAALVVSMGITLSKSKKLMVLFLTLTIIFSFFGAYKLLYKSDRLDIWKRTIVEIKKYPLTGSGLGTFKLLHLPYKKDGRYIVKEASPFTTKINGKHWEYIRNYNSHNTFLTLARESGVIVTFPILVLVLTIVYRYFRSDKNDLQRIVFGCFSGFFVGMLFDFPERNIGTAMLLVTLIAANHVLIGRIK